MSLNHLKNFIGENLHIGCLELVSQNPILLDDKAIASVKQDQKIAETAPLVIWGEATNYTAGEGGTITNAFSYYWDASVAGRCFVTVSNTTNFNRNGVPIIMVNTRNVVGLLSNPELTGFCYCAKLINSYTIELDFFSYTSTGNRPFMLAIIY